MAPSSAPAATHDTAPAPERHTPIRRSAPLRASPAATDDEILGLAPTPVNNAPSVGERNILSGEDAWEDADHRPESTGESKGVSNDGASPDKTTDTGATVESESLRTTLDANPELRRAWDDAQAYRETFATPEEARAATAQLADLDRMDALFFSHRPEDHAELARAVAALDPAAFASLSEAMSRQAASSAGPGLKPVPTAEAPTQAAPSTTTQTAPTTTTQTQSDFFHSTNAAAVRSVLDAIETQVERLLPESISKSARNRVVGEIYRELDTTLSSNRQLAQQMREAFRSGSLDAEHQRAVVSLVTGRARQALPGVAKRVLNEWTSTVVAAHHDRRSRQQAAERRVDIGGSSGTGSDGPRSMTPREIDYRRMSDADILNL